MKVEQKLDWWLFNLLIISVIALLPLLSVVLLIIFS